MDLNKKKYVLLEQICQIEYMRMEWDLDEGSLWELRVKQEHLEKELKLLEDNNRA